MKPFDPTRPVVTRDGRKARILCTDCEQDGFPIVALVGQCEQGLHRYRANGEVMFIHHSANHDDYRLVNIPEKRKYWVLMIKDCRGLWPAGPFSSKESADCARASFTSMGNYVATHEGEYEVESSC